MAQKKTEQTPIAPVENKWGQMVKSAKPQPELYPKLRFGNDKLWEGITDVLVMDEEPRVVTFDDPFADEEGAQGTAYVLNVQVLAGSEPKDSMRALFIPSDENHGLTRGVLAASQKSGGSLRGVALRIETKNYQNKRYKTTTRGYTVSVIPPPASPAP